MTTFASAREVRAFLKENGINRPFSVRWRNSPFSGCPGRFWVKIKDVKGSIISADGTHYGNDAPTINDLASIAEILADTNARVTV